MHSLRWRDTKLRIHTHVHLQLHLHHRGHLRHLVRESIRVHVDHVERSALLVRDGRELLRLR